MGQCELRRPPGVYRAAARVRYRERYHRFSAQDWTEEKGWTPIMHDWLRPLLQLTGRLRLVHAVATQIKKGNSVVIASADRRAADNFLRLYRETYPNLQEPEIER